MEQMRNEYSTLFNADSESNGTNDDGDKDESGASGFLERWGWEYNVDQCAENERLTHDEVYTNWNVIRFLNKLCYLKDKGKFLIALNGSK